MDVCVCFHGLYGTQTDTSSVPRPPAEIGGYRLCSHWAQLPLGKLFFYLKLSFSCLSLFPNSSPVPRSSVWKDKLVRKVALPSKFTGKQRRHKQWHPHRHWKYHLDEWMCVRARVRVYSSNCKKGTVFLSVWRYNVIRNISVQEVGFLRILSQHCGGNIRKWVHLSAVTTVNFIENTPAQTSGLCTCEC